jgi:hypothetical protein
MFLEYMSHLGCQFTCIVYFFQSKNCQDVNSIVSVPKNANQPTVGQDSLWTAEGEEDGVTV